MRHLMMAHIITRHMREVVRCYAQQLAIASELLNSAIKRV